MIIKSVHIDKFRALHNVNFELGSKLTAIVGHNGTMKTSVLGILSQTFTISKGHPMYGEKTIDGYNFKSQFKEKFKLSEKDIPGEHKWKLNLYPGIYKRDYFEVASMPRQKNEPIRFWSTEGRKTGTGYPQVPAYYLSLKRVSPIGEEEQFNYLDDLTSSEKQFLQLEYKDIMSEIDNSLAIDTIESSQKFTASIHNPEHDALSISAGQDNLGKILISVLSFKRLKESYKDEYKGGLLLIDEIESTFHSLAQQKLIKRLYRYATDYKIQFIFTTHSPSVIKATFFDKHNTKEAKLVYLKKEGDKVNTKNAVNVNDVVSELSGSVSELPVSTKKITIFSEDTVAQSFIKSLLNGGYRNNVNFSSCSIGAEEYLELVRVKLQPLTNSIIILDGDKNKPAILSKIKRYKAKNIIFLPSNYCPEELFYRFLYSLEDTDPFWNNELGGYDKKKCFAEYTTLIDRDSSSTKFKDWFSSQTKYWSRGNSKLYNYWKLFNQAEHKDFINTFIQAFNPLAQKEDIPLLDSIE
ncbi:AAA family ATPase [Anaerostipes hominis (ex Lee et al. 2021)]|uniref:AAA family ATPase n=1 Tax=Anaerostipes hominis (ex Lee et al. 2021) TaxID=2025494 RepID=UPI0022E488F1|nr:AAA family ATPase [Anaerostipes hominis (ex Lee et al. 2021)]